MQILNNNIFEANGSIYNTTTFNNGKTDIVITHVTGQINRVTVNYKNATNKAFRGLGKDFNSFDEAQQAYKLPAIKTALLIKETL